MFWEGLREEEDQRSRLRESFEENVHVVGLRRVGDRDRQVLQLDLQERRERSEKRSKRKCNGTHRRNDLEGLTREHHLKREFFERRREPVDRRVGLSRRDDLLTAHSKGLVCTCEEAREEMAKRCCTGARSAFDDSASELRRRRGERGKSETVGDDRTDKLILETSFEGGLAELDAEITGRRDGGVGDELDAAR